MMMMMMYGEKRKVRCSWSCTKMRGQADRRVTHTVNRGVVVLLKKCSVVPTCEESLYPRGNLEKAPMSKTTLQHL